MLQNTNNRKIPANLPADFFGFCDFVRTYTANRTTAYRHIEQGKLPKPTRYSYYFVGWSMAEIQPYLSNYTPREV